MLKSFTSAPLKWAILLGWSFVSGLYGQPKSPNFIVVYVDDLGWTDTSVEMVKGRADTKSDFYQTPALEDFAKASMVFSNGYASAPVCTPSRNSMLHGMTPAYLWNSVLHADRSIANYRGKLTIPQALKKANQHYQTAHFGKWHIPAISPQKAGFDVSDGPTGNGEGDYMDDMVTVLPKSDPKRMIELTDKTIRFMEDQVKADQPFFVQLSHYAVHIWHDSKLETRNKYRKLPRGKKAYDSDYLPEDQISESDYKHNWIINYAAMIEEMDLEFGRLLESVQQLGIENDTYIIFTSDNGGGLRGNEPLQGAKGDLTEGGIRVPYIIRGPKVLKNSYVNTSIAGWDILPTLYDLAGGTEPLPQGIEGGSFKNVLEKGQKAEIHRKNNALFFHFPWYNGEPESAIIIGNMKVLKNLDTQVCQLFDITKDPGELNDLSKLQPDMTRSMEKKLTRYLDSVDAEDVVTLREGYLDRMENSWLPTEMDNLAKLRLKMGNGDNSVKKEIDRITGYIKWMKTEIAFTKRRLASAK
jgi:arylsulfatase A-like enzyme